MFRIKLSPETQARLDAERAEIARLFTLPDSELGGEILRYARVIRDRCGIGGPDPDKDTYNTTLLNSVVPEVARRLGAGLGPDEVPRDELAALDGQAFRDYVAVCLVNVSRMHYRDADRDELLGPVSVLFHDYHNGCPVAFALDRLVPPTPESDDPVARGLREVSANRGFDPVPAWTPELQEWRSRAPDDAPVISLRF